jgi:hypothetical protein
VASDITSGSLLLQTHSAVTGIPPGSAVVLCIDDEDNAPDFNRCAQAAPRRGGEELAAETLALAADVCRNPREPEPRHIVPGKAAANRG